MTPGPERARAPAESTKRRRGRTQSSPAASTTSPCPGGPPRPGTRRHSRQCRRAWTGRRPRPRRRPRTQPLTTPPSRSRGRQSPCYCGAGRDERLLNGASSCAPSTAGLRPARPVLPRRLTCTHPCRGWPRSSQPHGIGSGQGRYGTPANALSSAHKGPRRVVRACAYEFCMGNPSSSGNSHGKCSRMSMPSLALRLLPSRLLN